MKIASIRNISWVSIECTQDSSGPPNFEIEVYAGIRNGQFHAKNLNIHLFNLEEFVAEFDRFILDRSLGPRLEGSYNTFIAFSATGNMVICQYRLGGAFSDRKTMNFHHFGEFEIAQEHLLQLLENFRALLKAQHF
ncbi:MAG: hypothetical protein ACM3KE_12060 [Hyphomicrobiales bacterium]